jgi:hypothetical protein
MYFTDPESMVARTTPAMGKASTQIDKFEAAARELETDDDEKRFDEKLGKIAKQKPTGPPVEKGKSSNGS